MMRRVAPVAVPLLLATLTACGSSGGGDGASGATIRDSAGIALVEYPADAWANATAWSLSANPMATVPQDPTDTTIDLSNSQLAALLDDGRVVAASIEPPQIYVFNADGSQQGLLGRGGEGPGEYRMISALLVLGGDSVVAYDFFSRHALIFDADGEAIGDVQFPMGGTQIPPLLMARLNHNRWLFQVINPLAQPPEGSTGIYRVDEPVLTWSPGGAILDTLVMLPGASMVRGTFDIAGQSIQMGKVVGYGANTFVGGHGDLIWSTGGDRFVLTARDTSGAVRREVRLPMSPRPVSDADKEVFKAALREQWEQARSFGAPAELVDSELEKIEEETTFAENRPAIGQMVVDRLGRLWVTPDAPAVDSALRWGVFDAQGELLGVLQLPKGMLLTASEDRVVLRREDDETGLVRLEVWGLNRTCTECDPPTP
jgi:hypothetical protein